MSNDPLILATEIWKPDADGYLLELADGFYRDSVEFDSISREMVFGRGEGLPGRVWEDDAAVHLDTLQVPNFKRAKAAKKAGLDAAIGLPFHLANKLEAVVVFFFAEPPPAPVAALLAVMGTNGGSDALFDPTATPIAGRIEYWALDTSGQRLVRTRGIEGGEALPEGELAEDATIDQGLVAGVFADGVPKLVVDTDADCTIALPVQRDGAVVGVVTLSL